MTVTEVLQAGLRHHQAGNLGEAERAYRQVLQAEPGNADALHLLGLVAQQVGKLESAVEHIEAAIALAPSQPAFHDSLANVCLALGRLDQALARSEEAIRLQPDRAKARLTLANIRRAQGRMNEAEAVYREILRLWPGHPEASNNLANVLRGRGQIHEAEACYRVALQGCRDDPLMLANLGAVLRERGELDEAEACIRKAVQLRPNLAMAHSYLGDVLLDRGNPGDAEFCYRESLRLTPTLFQAQRGLGVALHRQGRWEEAEVCYRQAIHLRPHGAEARVNLGDLMRDVHNIPAAREAYREAVRQQPDLAEAHNNLGTCLIEEGRPAEAIKHLREALRLRPGFVPALGNLATLDRDGLYAMSDAEVAQMRALLTTSSHPEPRSMLAFSLANLLDKRGQHDEAFAYYAQANELKRQSFQQRGQGFDAAGLRRFTDNLLATATPAFFRRVEAFGLPTELPVFIVGMPRSGTTLVEQILASHPEVFGAGELDEVLASSHDLGRSLWPPEDYPACLDRVDANLARTVAGRHLQRLTQRGGASTRVIDKLPANIFHLALIYLLFPKARILHCVRDSLDTCVSCYLQDFTKVNFANRLEDIAAYYQQYARLVAHWQAVFPGPLLEVRYEELIANQEDVSRQLVAFCGLDWDDRCLAFYETRRVVQTASVAQVRQPIYRSAIGRWQRYQRHLTPLFNALNGCFNRGRDSLP